MLYRQVFTGLLFSTLLWSQPSSLNGNWHVRVMDGMDVRKARAILDLDLDKMKLSGFDACNRMNATLIKQSENNVLAPKLSTTRMACRENIHTWVSQRLHKMMKEGFSIKEEKRYGIKGLTLKSSKHELFLKKMGKN